MFYLLLYHDIGLRYLQEQLYKSRSTFITSEGRKICTLLLAIRSQQHFVGYRRRDGAFTNVIVMTDFFENSSLITFHELFKQFHEAHMRITCLVRDFDSGNGSRVGEFICARNQCYLWRTRQSVLSDCLSTRL